MQIPSNGMRQFPSLAFLPSLLLLQLQLQLQLLLPVVFLAFCLPGASCFSPTSHNQELVGFSHEAIYYIQPAPCPSCFFPPTDTLLSHTLPDFLPQPRFNFKKHTTTRPNPPEADLLKAHWATTSAFSFVLDAVSPARSIFKP